MPRLIDADALIKWCVYCADDDIIRVNRQVMIYMLEHAPTIDPVKHGRWKRADAYSNMIICDECGEPFQQKEHWNYCPNCGAKMDEEGEDAD